MSVGGRLRFTRGLRFRLTAGYAVFFTLLLAGIGFFFRQQLKTALDQQVHDVLEQEWAAVKGYLRIEKRDDAIWFYDRNDPDEAFIVERLRRVYLLANAQGVVIESSDSYRSMGLEPARQIAQWVEAGRNVWYRRSDPAGVNYQMRAGVMYDERHKLPYFIAIGRELTGNERLLRQFTLTYVALIPMMIVAGLALGWLLAGRALTPVTRVAEAAQRIGGSNLSLRIPGRGAGDELDSLIDTFNGMIARLESSFQQIRQFSTDVSHELRTPITAIRGQLEVALFTAQSVEQYREAIFTAMQDVERLSQIVRALLLLSQAESGQLALQKAPLDLAEAAGEIADQFLIPAESARIRLTRDLERGCVIDADRIQIERMLANLLSNAVKFTPADGEVAVRLRRAEGAAELTVDDTGCGIAPEHLPHIFNRFYQVRSHTGAEKGLGLGLSFVDWIVRAHGGRIEVASEPGKGTRFTVTLPLAQTVEAVEQEQAAAPL